MEADRLMQHLLTNVIEQARKQVSQPCEPRFGALLETTAEVLIGLRRAFQHYEQGREKAWERPAE